MSVCCLRRLDISLKKWLKHNITYPATWQENQHEKNANFTGASFSSVSFWSQIKNYKISYITITRHKMIQTNYVNK